MRSRLSSFFLCAATLWCFAPVVFAQNGDPADLFLNAYSACQKAEKLEAAGNLQGALQAYREAGHMLDNIANTWPSWNQSILGYRRKLTAQSISNVQQKIVQTGGTIPTFTPGTASPTQGSAPVVSNSASPVLDLPLPGNETSLMPEGHSFLADDVMDVLPRLVRRGEKFDCIILDPPTFSRGHKGRRWQVEEHLADLLALGLELATPKANILLSTNCTRIRRVQLEEMARFGLRLNRRSGRVEPGAPLPDFPPGAAAQTVWISVE